MGRTKSLKHSFKEDVVRTATVRISQIRRSMVRRRTTNTGVVELKNKEDKAPSYADEDARVFDEEGNALIADSKA